MSVDLENFRPEKQRCSSSEVEICIFDILSSVYRWRLIVPKFNFEA